MYEINMRKKCNKLYSNPLNSMPISIWDKIIVEQPIIINGKKIMIEALINPEEIYINFSGNAEENAKRLLLNINDKINKSIEDLPFIWKDDKISEFLFYSFSCIVYSYTAIDTYLNTYIETNNLILSDKPRHSLQEKILFICKKLKIKQIKDNDLLVWNNFSELEVLRNDIIHSKQSYYINVETLRSVLLISKVLNWKFEWKTELAIKIIKYFKENEPKNGWWVMIVERWLQSKPV